MSNSKKKRQEKYLILIEKCYKLDSSSKTFRVCFMRI